VLSCVIQRLTFFIEYADLDFHIAGESYGGHYIPVIADTINKNNKKHAESKDYTAQNHLISQINLKSLLIGNGLTDPLTQYGYYEKMACDNSYGAVLNRTSCEAMEAHIPACERFIKNCYKKQTPQACVYAQIKCTESQFGPYESAGRSPYDIRKPCVGDFCYAEMDLVPAYLNRSEVMQALGAEVKSFANSNEQVKQNFVLSGDWMLPIVRVVPGLLEDGIKILIYAGDADFICNWMGNKAWTIKMPWSGHEEFSHADDTAWYSERLGKQAGELRKTEDGAFAFLRVFGAGHMVPLDQPESSLDMMQQWLSGNLH
jgi:cathepsin A (carboxypeptidase C)